MKFSLILGPVFVLGAQMLSGCAAMNVALSKKNLDVQTKMSATLFLDPVEDESAKTFFLQAKNTSDKGEFDVAEELRKALVARGLRPVSSPQQAHYFLQLNVLQVGKVDPSAAEASVYRGYGADGAAIGAGTAYVAGGSDKVIVGAGILGGIGAVIADSLVKDVHFAVTTDLQIKERMPRGQKATHSVAHHNQSGTSGGTTSSYVEKSDWKIYQTRILSSANKVNLKFEDASPELRQALVRSIAGIF